MDPGVLIYIAFFIIVAIIQGAGQKKKEDQRRSRTPPPDTSTGGEAGTTTSVPRSSSPGPSGSRTREPGTSSEGMVPEDIWEEILGLAKGEAPAKKPAPPREKPVPEEGDEVEIYRPPGSLEEIPSVEARTLEKLEPRKEPDRSGRRELLARKGPASAAVEAALAGETPEGLGRPITEGERRPRMRRRKAQGANVFGDGSIKELRKAIILKEVLGPPVGLRETDGPGS